MHAPSAGLTLILFLEVLGPIEQALPQFDQLVGRMGRDVVRAGAVHSWADGEKMELGTVLSFSDAHQMRVHMEAVSMWDESRRLAKHARVKWVRVHGEVDPMVAGWIAQWGLSRAILKDERGAAVGSTADAGGAAHPRNRLDRMRPLGAFERS